jgi:hypothetical protein
MRRLALTCFLLSASLVPAKAGGPFAPGRFPQIDYGFKQLRGRGLAAAVASWTYESRIADPARLAEKAKVFADIEKKLGDCTGHQIVEVIPLGGGSSTVFASAQYWNGTIFFRFLYFSSGIQETVNDVTWSLDPFEVWPDAIVARLRSQ